MTWNPVLGCTPVSEGCRYCYAATMAHRFSDTAGSPFYGLADQRGGRAVFNGTVRLRHDKLNLPLRWRLPRRIFVNSMSDLFHDAVPDEFIAAVFCAASFTPRHTYQILTKRPERAVEWFKKWDGSSIVASGMDAVLSDKHRWRDLRAMVRGFPWPLPNVWIGVTVEDQAAADRRIPLLLDIPARVRFLSCEPLLGEVLIRREWRGLGHRHKGQADDDAVCCCGKPMAYHAGVDWVIAGGESGPRARPCFVDHVRSLRDQCHAAGVAFHFKQWGDAAEVGAHECFDVLKKHGGCLLDGREWKEFPA